MDVLAENNRLKAEKPAPTEDHPGLKVMIEDLQRQNQDLLTKIERVDLMSSPKFQKEFLVPRGNMFAEAKEVLKDAGIDPETLDRVMALTGKAKIDALDGIISEIPSQVLRDRLGRLVDGMDAKTREINEQLRNAKGTREQLTRQEKIEQHAQIVEMEQQMKTALQMTRRDLAENRKIELLYKTGRPEYKWFDDLVDSVDATAQEVMLRSRPEQLPTIAYYAALYEPTHDLLQAERKARIAAEDRLAAIEGVEPTLGEDKRLPKPVVDDDADIKTAVFAHLKSGRK